MSTEPEISLEEQLAKISKQARFRRKLAEEVLSTEKSYVESIEAVLEVYLKPLKNDLNILSDMEIGTLFNDFSIIPGLNRKLLIDIEKRITSWPALPIIANAPQPPTTSENIDKPKEVEPVDPDIIKEQIEAFKDVDSKCCIGDIFVSFAPFFKMYTQYASNNEKGLALLRELRDNNDKFVDFAEECTLKPICKGQNLESFLIMPIQRIPRYKLLLGELIRYTPASHEDTAALVKADSIVNVVAKHINEAVRAREASDKLLQIQNEFTGNVVFVNVGRTFIRRGTLVKKCRSDDKSYEFLLFSDLLVYASMTATGKYKVHNQLSLDSSFSVEDLPDLTTKNRFQINSTAKSFLVYAPSTEDKYAWLADIMHCLSTLQSTIKADINSGISAKPIWQSDVSSSLCNLCKEEFNLFKRRFVFNLFSKLFRHHCRKCGILCCDNCSSSRMVLPNSADQTKLERVCDSCALEIKKIAAENMAKRVNSDDADDEIKALLAQKPVRKASDAKKPPLTDTTITISPVDHANQILKARAGISFGRTKFEYIADDDTGISVEAGSLIIVLKKDDSGWWSIMKNIEAKEASGLFPSNYLEEVSADVAATLLPSTANVEIPSECPFDVIAISDASVPEPVDEELDVSDAEEQNNPAELHFRIGDLITVWQKDDSGWWFGTHSTTNATGWFPAESAKLKPKPIIVKVAASKPPPPPSTKVAVVLPIQVMPQEKKPSFSQPSGRSLDNINQSDESSDSKRPSVLGLGLRVVSSDVTTLKKVETIPKMILPPTIAESAHAAGACTQCECKAFRPNMFKKQLCQDCRHNESAHTNS